MVWVIGGLVLLSGLFALVERLTEPPIMRRRVNAGTDRYRASLDYIARDQNKSIWDMQVGSGRASDPMVKRAPTPGSPSGDDDRASS